MIKAIAQATAVAIAIVIGALALWQMREAVQLLVVALAVSAGISPAIGRLRERGLRREWAIGTVLLLVLATIGMVLLALGSQLLLELEEIVAALPVWYDYLRAILGAQGEWAADIALALPSSNTLIARLIDPEALPDLLMALATRLTIVVVLVIGALSLGFYWLVDQTRIERLWLSLLPLQARSRAREVWMRVYQEVGLYVRGGVMLAVVTSGLLLIGYTLIGLPGATLLALFGGLALIVPVLGPMLAVLPPLLVTLTRTPETALLTIIVVGLVIALVKGVVSPRLFREGVTVNPVLTIICIMALGEVGGIGLILLGPPLAAAIQTTVQALRSEPAPIGVTQQRDEDTLDALQARLDTIAASAEQTPQVQSLIERARSLVHAAEANSR
jgi:predicted PurR-regulated permease PerM